MSFCLIILAGGKGTRMKKSNISGPKILYKFANKYLFEHIITSIKNISYTSLSFLCNKKNIVLIFDECSMRNGLWWGGIY